MTHTIKFTLENQDGSSVYTLNTDDLPKSVIYRVLAAAIEVNIHIGNGDLAAADGSDAESSASQLEDAINLLESYAKHQPA